MQSTGAPGRAVSASMLAPAAWAPLPPLLVAWAVYAQVVSFRGLVIWVALGSLVTWILVGALFTARRPWAAMGAGMACTLLLAVAADRLGGSTSGPLARSTLLVVGLLVAALILAFSSVPVLSLAPMLAMLACSLALGAAGNAITWIGAWVVAAACSLVILGPYGARLLAAPLRLRSLASLFAVLGVTTVAVAALASVWLGRPWMIAGAEANFQPPPVVLAEAPPPVIDPSTAPSTSSSPTAQPVQERLELSQGATAVIAPASLRTAAAEESSVSTWVVWVLLAVAILLLWGVLLSLLLLAWFIGRRMVVWAQWQWLRLHLASGGPESRLIGAWTWARLRLARCGEPLPAWASPDATVDWATARGDDDLAHLARLVARLAFNPAGESTEAEAALAWRLARSALRGAQSASLRVRIARAAIPPRPESPGLGGDLPSAPGLALTAT